MFFGFESKISTSFVTPAKAGVQSFFRCFLRRGGLDSGLRRNDNQFDRIRSFTLTELLIVIAVLAVLSSAVILILNPGEFLAQARDSQRVSDVDSLSTAVGLYASSVRGSKGVANKVYISIPSANADCSGVSGLPVLSGGWTYACATEVNYKKTDGTGWLPVNLNALPGGSIVQSLPIDPKNETTKYLYYTYAISGADWEISAATESKKISQESASDGGSTSLLYERGSNLAILPSYSIGSSCSSVHTDYPHSGDGLYWIDVDGAGVEPTIQVNCDMTNEGGGWTQLNANLATIAVNKGTANWSGSDIVGTGFGTSCSVNVRQYTLNNVKLTYNSVYTLLNRTTSILQCSGMGQSSGGYYTAPYSGTFTSAGMCTWGDGAWANACCSATNMTGLKLDWIMKKTGLNAALYYDVHCSSSDTGVFTMKWFVR